MNRRALRALEIGCGPGRLMKPLSRNFGEIHGVDVSDEMVRLAREREAHDEGKRLRREQRPRHGRLLVLDRIEHEKPVAADHPRRSGEADPEIDDLLELLRSQ